MPRHRIFLFGDQELTRCGVSPGSGAGGISYFCNGCGKIWGSVALGWVEWVAVSVPCSLPHRGFATRTVPGSYLRPLYWWDHPNGTSLADQVNNADSALLHYEALRWAEWVLADAMPALPIQPNQGDRNPTP